MITDIDTLTAKQLADIRGLAVDEFLYGRQAALTEQQRDMLELFNSLTQKQQEEFFRKIFKARNRRTTSS